MDFNSNRIAAAVSAFVLFNSETSKTKDSTNEIDKISESFKRVEERAKAAGETIKTVAKFGAFADAGPDTLDQLEQKINETQGLFNRRTRTKTKGSPELVKTGGQGGAAAGQIYKEVDQITAQINEFSEQAKSYQSQYDEAATALIKSMRDELKTEEEKLNEKKEQYQNLLKKNTIEKDRQDIEEYIKRIDEQIADAKKAEKDAAQKNLKSKNSKRNRRLKV